MSINTGLANTGLANTGLVITGLVITGLANQTSIKTSFASSLSFAGLVAFGGAPRPDPIPNSAVKRSSANGTMSQDLGE